MQSQVFTIHQSDLSPIVSYAEKICGSKTERGGKYAYARFSVKNGGFLTQFNRVSGLSHELSFFVENSTCRVFRNAAKGVTIDFDFEKE